MDDEGPFSSRFSYNFTEMPTPRAALSTRESFVARKCWPPSGIRFTDLVEFDASIPEESLGKRLGSCAVVASGGSLYQAGKGESIDAHDFVIRMNSHPIHTWERDVGKRTDLRLFYPESSNFTSSHVDAPEYAVMMIHKDFDRRWTRCALDGAGRRKSGRLRGRSPFLRRTNVTLQALYGGAPFTSDKGALCECAHAGPGRSYDAYTACRGEVTFRQLGVATKMFEMHRNRCYKGFGLNRVPSMGFTALMFGLSMCKSVDLYGIEPHSSGRCRYFSKDTCAGYWTKTTHDMNSEHTLLRVLERAGLISIH